MLGSNLYARLLELAAEDAGGGGPTWRVIEGDLAEPGPSALALRLMGAVNRLVLAGREPALGSAYRDGSGDAAWPAFRSTLERNEDELCELVERPVQTNEVGRCAALLFGFATIHAESGLPLRLLEVGASAGLNLRWDRYRYESDGFAWGASASPLAIDFAFEGEAPAALPAEIPVTERRGCDPAPLDPGSRTDRETLLAYIWPDQTERLRRLRAALEVAAELPLAVERDSAAAWTRARLAESGRGGATVVFHSVVAQYLGEEERAAFASAIAEAGAGASAEAPLAWLRMEPDGDRAALDLSIWPGGESRRLGRAGYHGTPVKLHT